MSQLVVGVTGGIGSGKTTVTDFFQSKGIAVIDADVIAREVVTVGTSGLAAIQSYFGEKILLASGELDRRALRNRVFQNVDEKVWLDTLLHPMIREQMIRQSRSAESVYSILSIPLLVENELMSLVDRVLVVDIDEDLQFARAVARDAADTSSHKSNGAKDSALNNEGHQTSKSELQKTEKTINAIMQNQCTRQQRLAVADDVVNNNKDIEHLRAQLVQLHSKYLDIANNYKNE